MVSIISLTYNHAEYLGKCLDSVRKQTYSNWEHIVVDDGSLDGTPQIVAEHSDSRTHYIRKEHEGVIGFGKAYNTALAEAKGDLIAILDGDDYWPQTKLESQVAFFNQKDVLLAWGEGTTVDQVGRTIGRSRAPVKGQPPIYLHSVELLPMMFWRNIITPTSGVVLRRETLERVGGFHQPKGLPLVDMATWLRIIAKMRPTEVFVYANKPVAFWRIRPDQISADYGFMMASRARMLSEFLKELRAVPGNVSPDCLARLAIACSWQTARSAIAARDWARARESLQTCWNGESLPIGRQVLFATVWYVVHFDPFSILPSFVRFTLPARPL